MNHLNPIKLPFLLFVRYDPVSKTAWLQASPEPAFNDAVLWTVPTGQSFADTFYFATETAPDGLLNGIIYYQTVLTSQLSAVYMHNGQKLWTYTLPTSPKGSPIIATKQGLNSRYFLFTPTATENGISLQEIGCCSDRGLCTLNQTVCSCNKNYYGAACEIYCNVSACESMVNGVQRGKCSAGGCTCNANFYGALCQTECTPTATCGNHGTCNKVTGACVCKSAQTFDFAVYSGNFCEMQQTNWLLIASIVGGALVVLLIIVIIIVSCTRRKSSKKNKYDLINN